MIGMHIHGIKRERDHLAPFDGDMDFNKILPFLNNNIPCIIESKYATAQQIKFAILQIRNSDLGQTPFV